jgi:hypothetical protein
METYISEADIMVSIKKHRDSLSYDELFDVEMETKRMQLSDKKREKLKNQRKYVEYLSDRYERHKKKKS